MTITATVNRTQFHDAFKAMGRSDQFSMEGLNLIYDYLEDYTLDVIAICCDFGEHADLEDYNEEYGTTYEDIDQLSQDTLILQGSNCFIFQNI